tara:strand:+ start:401 stop:553 length:153 start_codon:yes stop_codon:yes gene_type:complete
MFWVQGQRQRINARKLVEPMRLSLLDNKALEANERKARVVVAVFVVCNQA